MGLAPSQSPACSGETGESRWPPPLQNVTLAGACNFYTSLRELSSPDADFLQLKSCLGLSDAHVVQVFKLFGDPAVIPIWEVLVTVVFSSPKIAKNTKLLFAFRIWDHDKDQQLTISEVAFLLRTVLRGVSKYLEWDLKDNAKAFKDYVRATFPRVVTEDTFVHWGQRQPVLWSTLIAFTPRSSTLPDQVDFKLSEPLRRANMPKTTVVMQPASMTTLNVVGKFKAKARASQVAAAQVAAATKAMEPISICLPPVVSGAKRDQHRKRVNKPFIHLGAQGRPGNLTMDEARASWNDACHTCPLHKNLTDCLILTRHEVYLAGRIFSILKDSHGEISYESAKGLWAFMQSETSAADSLLAQGQRHCIFKLCDEKRNPLFGKCLNDLCSGTRPDMSFHEYLKMLCPCASNARLDLFVRWQSKGWEREQEFLHMVKKWRQSSIGHWGHQVIPVAHRKHDFSHSLASDATGQLSIQDLIHENVITDSAAQEVMQQHGLDVSTTLDWKSFTSYFPAGKNSTQIDVFAKVLPLESASTQKDVFEKVLPIESASTQKAAFESALKKKQDAKRKSLSFRPTAPSDYKPALTHTDAIKNGNMSMDEFTGNIDIQTVLGLFEVYHEEIDGKLTVDDFQTSKVEADIEEEEV